MHWPVDGQYSIVVRRWLSVVGKKNNGHINPPTNLKTVIKSWSHVRLHLATKDVPVNLPLAGNVGHSRDVSHDDLRVFRLPTPTFT